MHLHKLTGFFHACAWLAPSCLCLTCAFHVCAWLVPFMSVPDLCLSCLCLTCAFHVCAWLVPFMSVPDLCLSFLCLSCLWLPFMFVLCPCELTSHTMFVLLSGKFVAMAICHVISSCTQTIQRYNNYICDCQNGSRWNSVTHWSKREQIPLLTSLILSNMVLMWFFSIPMTLVIEKATYKFIMSFSPHIQVCGINY